MTSEGPVVSRREWLALVGATGVGWGLSGGLAGGLTGCSTTTRPALTLREASLLKTKAGPLPIVQWNPKNPDPHSVLRRRAKSARSLDVQHRKLIDRRMRATLTSSGGVGLAAPQVGLSRRQVLVEYQRSGKPVGVFLDPQITRRSKKTVDGYEACLSIKGYGGLVRRAQWVELTYYDLAGKKKRYRSEGWEARIIQHELDHLAGKLYVDRLVGKLLPIEEMRRRRRQEKQKGAHPPSTNLRRKPIEAHESAMVCNSGGLQGVAWTSWGAGDPALM